MAAVEIRGTSYPVLLPKLRDPRLHLAATITSLQVIGQVGFHFRLSIAQILISLATCAVLETGIAFRTQRVLMWPASAMLTGNGVAFVLRVPGTVHGDWWSTRGWWIFAATAAGSLLSKHLVKWRGEHVFNPSNIGLVVCFLALGRGRVEPLDFWWGPMSPWLVAALVVIVSGGFLILSRLRLLRVALSFWAAFALGIAGLALAGHALTARWHLGPLTGFHLWSTLVTSPEVLVFLFFMITDPKTAPRGPRARLAYGIALGVLASLLIAPTTTEFAAKVALLSSLAIVCVASVVVRELPSAVRSSRLATATAAAGLASYALVAVLANSGVPAVAAVQTAAGGTLPPISILPSPGVQTPLTRPTAEAIAYALLAARPELTGTPLRLHLVQGNDQSPPFAVAQAGSRTLKLQLTTAGIWTLASGTAPAAARPLSTALAGERLTNVAAKVGLDFRQGSFRFGVTPETKAMMGGGLCWLDYNRDGWVDLFAVNSYASADAAQWQARGGLPTSALYENVHGRFVDVTRRMHAGLAVQGDGCAAADLNGDGRTDLVVTTTSGVEVLWNGPRGFTRQALPAVGWFTGVAVADVNGDGRPDVFVAGYADPNEPVPNSLAGFPTNLTGVRDLLFLNEGGHRFREVGVQAGLEAAFFRHGLGAVFTDVNGDGRPDLYVANDEDPNELYVNVPWPGGAKADPAGLGFRFEERAAAEGVADPFAGMGIAAQNGLLFVTNSRGEPPAAYRRAGATFGNERPSIDPAVGTGAAGWGASWVDLANSGRPDLVLATGAIPVTNLRRDAQPLRVVAPSGSGFGDATSVLGAKGLRMNGRGLAAADVGNDGRMDVAVNTIGGRLALLRPSGPSGHWLDVDLTRFAPGAVVTAVLADGTRVTRELQAGSSYLSSEDPRVHFGLGSAKRVAQLAVRWPFGGVTRLHDLRVDRIIQVGAPPLRRLASAPASSPTLAACTPASGSVVRIWTRAAVAVLRTGGATQPVQARDLYDLAEAMSKAYAASPTPAAVSFTAYRLLLWQASYGGNMAQTFGLLTRRLRALCLSPDFVAATGSSPAAVGNRVAAAAIAAGRRDGSNEALHFADPSFTPANDPLVVGQGISTPHDATFWQPLALAQVSPRGSSPVPADVQVFAGSQWGRVATFAPAAARLDPGASPLGVPTSRNYRDAALAAIRATANAAPHGGIDPSPLGWNEAALALPSRGLAQDLRLELALNGALNDAAVAAWGAKRKYDAPRPISMIRYLAFTRTLPLVPGLTRKSSAGIEIRLGGRWVDGARWTPIATTPPSPGWVSSDAAFAYAADTVLSRLTGRSFAREAGRAATAGVAGGTELAVDVTAGRRLGLRVGNLALARIRALPR